MAARERRHQVLDSQADEGQQRLHRRPMATTAMRQGKGRLAGATPRRDWTPWEDGPRPTLSGSKPLSPPLSRCLWRGFLEMVEGWGRVQSQRENANHLADHSVTQRVDAEVL